MNRNFNEIIKASKKFISEMEKTAKFVTQLAFGAFLGLQL